MRERQWKRSDASGVGSDALYVRYHDEEWGVPVHDDRALFEMIALEGAQAGLSWLTILNKRANFRQAFDNFDPHKVSLYGGREGRATSGKPRNCAK